MIATAILAMLQVAAPVTSTDRLAFVCQEDNGRPFSVELLPRPAGVTEDDALSPYRVTGLREAETADSVQDSLPDFLTLVWRRQDGAQITLEIEEYDAEAKTAKFRLARESDPSDPIVIKSFSNGRCLAREVGGDTEHRQETVQ